MLIKIAIVDDKQINRTTTKNKLVQDADISIVLEAKNGIDFLQKLKEQPLDQFPDLALMDLEMPEMNGIETIRQAGGIYPQLKFIVLTIFEDSEKIFEAIKAGAGGYLLKEDTALNLKDAIVHVIEFNGIPMSPAIARKAMALLKESPVKTDTKESDTSNLTEREMEILKEMVTGKNYKAIGEKLFISPLTVKKHVSHIYEKLHVRNRSQIINLAYKKKWIN
ncbi:MAG: response regulator transcription factor [Chitinophagaceae bacterium]|uniref:response regulator transcription factor n=1 Tax=unclassified Paraflavitalea TaxID=2798305 RepID=UPI003D34B4F4|nr:response regulator transcription factor [Chitinophagaceae bacterium]